MTVISEKSILDAADRIDDLTMEDLEKLSEDNVEKQELLANYLLSSAIEFDNEELASLVIYYYNVFFEAAKLQDIKFKEIDEKLIEEFEEEYHQILDEYGDEDDSDIFSAFCNQPMMVEFMMSEIHGEDEEGETLSIDTKTQLLLVGMALIGLVDRAIIKQ